MPVWLKANDRKVKVNAILDDGSNETFLNEEVAGVLGLKERYQTVRIDGLTLRNVTLLNLLKMDL